MTVETGQRTAAVRQGRARTLAVLVDGPDFAGKSTICALLAAELSRRGVATRHSVGGLTSVTDAVYRILPASHLGRTVRTLPLLLLRDAVFLLTPLLDVVVRRWLWRRARVVVQEGYYDRVLCHHQVRGHRLAVRWARAVRGLVRFDLRLFLDVSFAESQVRYLASADPNRRDDIRFGPGAAAHQRLMGTFRELAREFGYQFVDTTQAGADALVKQLADQIEERLAATHKGATP